MQPTTHSLYASRIISEVRLCAAISQIQGYCLIQTTAHALSKWSRPNIELKTPKLTISPPRYLHKHLFWGDYMNSTFLESLYLRKNWNLTTVENGKYGTFRFK